MSESTLILALVFGSTETTMEVVMSEPALVLALIFGFVFLLMLLLAEKPHVQPTNEAHGLVPRAKEKSASGSLNHGCDSRGTHSGEPQKAGENAPTQGVAPVESPAPMNGAEALLMPLVSQFSQMQQQMFEQFQQSLLMTVQMFGNVQREQMALIRQELEQIQELTRQLHTLQSERMRPSAAPLPAAGQAAAPRAPTASLNWKPTASAARPDTPSAKPGDPDVHAWLTKRLATLQQERQSRWQKVLGMLTR